MNFKLLLASVILISSPVFATQPSSDNGKIARLYVNELDGVAVMLEGGFPNAVADNQCPSAGATPWGGNFNAGSLMKSVLLAAKVSGQSVTLTTTGCVSGNGWLKVIDVYFD